MRIALAVAAVLAAGAGGAREAQGPKPAPAPSPKAAASNVEPPRPAEKFSLNLPLEPAVIESDLIVVGAVLEAGQPAEMDLRAPWMGSPTRRWVRRFKISVMETIRDRNPPAEGRGNIEVLAYARPPGLSAADAARKSMVYYLTADLAFGGTYVLILQKLPDRQELFLQGLPMYWQGVADGVIGRVKAVCNLNTWPWGQADAMGLQLALIPRREAASGEARYVAAGGRGMVYVLAALRNASAAPLRVDLGPAGKPLSLAVLDAKGKARKHDVYGRGTPGGGADESRERTLEAGEVVFVGPRGPTKQSMALDMRLKAGKWQLQASFANPKPPQPAPQPLPQPAPQPATEPAPTPAEVLRVWAGEVQSLPTDIELYERKGPKVDLKQPQ